MGNFQIVHTNRFAVLGIGNDDISDSAEKVFLILSKAKDGHHFAGDGNDEVVLSWADLLVVFRYGNAAKRSVVHIHRTTPDNTFWIDVERVALPYRIIDDGGNQIDRGGQSVHISGEMEVDVFGWANGSKAAAGRAAFDAENGAKARLAKAKHRFLSDFAESFGQGDRSRGLAFAGFRRGDGGNQDKFAVFLIL